MKMNPSLYGADYLECKLAEAGWRRSPNNIYSLPSIHWHDNDPLKGESPEWYAAQGGMPALPEGEEVQVCSDRIRVFRPVFFGQSGTGRSYWDTVTVQVFVTAKEFLDYCLASGRLAPAGLPAGIHGD